MEKNGKRGGRGVSFLQTKRGSTDDEGRVNIANFSPFILELETTFWTQPKHEYLSASDTEVFVLSGRAKGY